MNAFHPLLAERRASVVRIVVLGAGLVILGAFFRIQILGYRAHVLQSETNRLRQVPLPAARGVIYDRAGRVLAENVPGFTVALLPGPEDSVRATLQRMARLAALDASDVERVIARYRRAPYQPVVVRADAPLAMVAALEERRLHFPGLLIQTEPKRHYPDSIVAAHLLGYVGEVAESERSQARFARVRLGGLVGKDGLERQYDDTLRGEDGMRFVEVSALGRLIRDDIAAPLSPVPGAALRTSVDLELQRFIAAEFPPGRRGAVVVLDPGTSAVLALYSAPGFDPNAFVGGVDPEYWRRLTDDPARPLLNRAIQARYPPGSTWKLAVAVAGLKRGVVGLRSRMPIPCRGGLQYGNRYFRCWEPLGHGDLTLEQAIAHSCDVYFYQLGLKLGVTTLLEDAGTWGGGSRTGIDLPGELQSEYPSGREYYDRLYGPGRWTSAVALNLAIGQGENAQTPINMARLFQMLAGDGTPHVPHLVRARRVRLPAALGLAPEQLEGLRQAMISVVESGTARGSRVAALTIGGKTATAQNSHGPDHGWFIGFAPADHPRVVVAAIIEFAEHGTAVAPLVTRIISRYLGVDSVDVQPLEMPRDTTPGVLTIPNLGSPLVPNDPAISRPR